MNEQLRLPDPVKVVVPVSDVRAIEWAISRKMRLSEIRPGVVGYEAVLERFADYRPPLGFPCLPGGRIEAEQVFLRYLTCADARMVHESDTDDVARRWALTEGKSLAEVEDAARRGYISWRLEGESSLVIVDSATGSAAGLIKVRKLVPPGVADVGYQVHPDFRGRGIATAGLIAFCRWAAQAKVFHRFELGIKPGNDASVTVARRAGFAFEGRRSARLADTGGTYSDELHYAKVDHGGPAARETAASGGYFRSCA